MKFGVIYIAALSMVASSSLAARDLVPLRVEGVASIAPRNQTPQCVNIAKQAVTVMITGVNVAKKDSLFEKVRGAGGRAETQLISSDPGKTYAYPAEAALDVRDLGNGIVHAPLAMTILGQYEFADDGKFKEIRLPFNLLKREGDSDIAKYSRALIAFTEKNGSAIPVPGLSVAASLVKDLSDGFFSELDRSASSEVKDPDFRIAYQLASTDSCPGPQFLHTGVYAQIRIPSCRTPGSSRLPTSIGIVSKYSIRTRPIRGLDLLSATEHVLLHARRS